MDIFFKVNILDKLLWTLLWIFWGHFFNCCRNFVAGLMSSNKFMIYVFKCHSNRYDNTFHFICSKQKKHNFFMSNFDSECMYIISYRVKTSILLKYLKLTCKFNQLFSLNYLWHEWHFEGSLLHLIWSLKKHEGLTGLKSFIFTSSFSVLQE